MAYPLILTKENFWNDLQEKYPEQMKLFCDWIDDYKKRVDWNTLFRQDVCSHCPDPPIGIPKFHEIPVAMQIGIYSQFLSEQNDMRLAPPMDYMIRMIGLSMAAMKSISSQPNGD